MPSSRSSKRRKLALAAPADVQACSTIDELHTDTGALPPDDPRLEGLPTFRDDQLEVIRDRGGLLKRKPRSRRREVSHDAVQGRLPVVEHQPGLQEAPVPSCRPSLHLHHPLWRASEVGTFLMSRFQVRYRPSEAPSPSSLVLAHNSRADTNLPIAPSPCEQDLRHDRITAKAVAGWPKGQASSALAGPGVSHVSPGTRLVAGR
jgi:hypothetical protein